MTVGSSPSTFDIWAEDIPDDANISKLCDCGHHKRKQRFQRSTPVLSQRNNGKLPETNYSETYKAVPDPRPRSSKRPVFIPRNIRRPNMSFETHQRSEFKPYVNVERRKPIYIKLVYEPPAEPFTSISSYQKDFIPKQRIPATPVKMFRKPNVPRNNGGTMVTTTSKDHYKPWPTQITLPFYETPSGTDAIIYPNKEPLPKSTSRFTYSAKIVPRPHPIKMAQTTLLSEGDMELKTTHQTTYKPYSAQQIREGNEDQGKYNKLNKGSQIGTNGHVKFDAKTHFQHVYPGFKDRQPSPAHMIPPPQPSLRLSHNNRQHFETEQRSTYKGYDVQCHPVRQSFKKDPEKYAKPTVKVETLSCQKRDYLPINPKCRASLQSVSAAPKSCMKSWGNSNAAFDGTTSHKEFFKRWMVTPRIQHGDPKESNNYVPPQTKFSSETTSNTTYTAKQQDKHVRPKPPSDKVLWPKKTPNDQEMTTNYRSMFKKPKVKLCKAQIYLIQQRLKKQSKNKPIPQSSMMLAVPTQHNRNLQKVQ
ncbi:uncharacterized protein LOC115221772 isoform X1 [Argonauta hians]